MLCPEPVRPLLQAVQQRLRRWTKPDNRVPVLDVALDLTRSKWELMIENTLLRRQLLELISAPETTLIRALVTAVRRDGWTFRPGQDGARTIWSQRFSRFIAELAVPWKFSLIFFL